MRVALLTNGPGELWGWARPVITELRKRGHSVSLWLLPCPFASGQERTVASQFGVDKLEGPSSAAWTWQALATEKTDCVVQLGGDLMFGRHIARKAKTPLLCYAYGYKKGMKHASVYTAYPSQALKMPDAKIIGDLVKDSLALDTGSFSWDPKAGPRLLLFPGSRPAIRRMALAWLGTIVQNVRSLVPDLQIRTLFSPFAPDHEFQEWRDASLEPLKAGAGIAMKEADYAITQPGTNTLEMMHCGLPALVAAPMDFLKVIPVAGLGGWISTIPLVGSAVKEHVIRKNLKRYRGMIAWPNRIAGRTIMDESFGDVGPQDLARLVAEALRDGSKLAGNRRELLAVSGQGGAAERLCNAVEKAAGRAEAQ